MLYRVSQFRRSLNPNVSASELKAARQALGEDLFPLFGRMHAADQRHVLDVFELLLSQGHTDRHLLQAALIHDSGKTGDNGEHISLWHRVAWVVVSPIPYVRDIAARMSPGLKALQDHGPRTVNLAAVHHADEAVVRLLEELEGLREMSPMGHVLKRADDAR